jgi:glycosyltransferase involved in cell wall biosynthesis
VGRFSWEKNPKVLIEAFSKIENKKNWKLVMAGTGPQLEEMKIKAINLGLKDKIDFPGKVSDIDFWYNKSSIFVLPSILEGFPNALCEAMAASLPVICFDSIPYESIITPNIDGLVIPITEKNSLEKALSELMTDKNKRTKIGNRAHQKSQDWKVEIIINKFNEFLKINE